MRRPSIPFLALLLVSGCASPPATDPGTDPADPGYAEQGATHEDFEDYCRSANCRGPLTVQLVLDDGSRFERFFDVWPPAVQETGLISILPGETLAVYAARPEAEPLAYAEAPSGFQPVNSLEFSLWQDTSMAAGSDMLLRIRSSFERAVKLDLYAMRPGSEDAYYTTSCPILPQHTSYEHWPYAIFQILVFNVRYVDASSAAACE